MSERREVNILLLGETGVGKSTLINAFVNYLHYDTLEEARASKLHHLIPTTFTITDENFDDVVISIGDKKDRNENSKIGESSTQGARAYEFQIDKLDVRLIDTPGIGDSRGITIDKTNFENILSYINTFSKLHAICFLLKPDVTVINPYFKFCITHLFSRLEKSASENIIFLFTNTRSTCYRPGQTLKNVRTILQEIRSTPPFVEIPCKKENIFCFDNEAFKFLVALKNGVRFTEDETKDFYKSWENSATTCWNMLTYILGDDVNSGLRPHDIQGTISINNARRTIIELSKPLADMADLIRDNLEVLRNHENIIKEKNISIEDLQKNLFVPSVDIVTRPLPEPGIVCTNSCCCTAHTVAGIEKIHYNRICAKPVYNTGFKGFLKGILDGAQLLAWTVMNITGTCKTCGCLYTDHDFISYETELITRREQDESVVTKIQSEAEKIEAQREAIKKCEEMRVEYAYEETVISKSMAKFAHFLQQNSILPFNDSYLNYLDHLIERENGAINDRVKRYQELKEQYVKEKEILSSALSRNMVVNPNFKAVTVDDIERAKEKVYKLKHTGKKIRELQSQQIAIVETAQEQTIKREKPIKLAEGFKRLYNFLSKS